MRSSLPVVVALLAPSLALAQVPEKVAYQGRLLGASGEPVSGISLVTFKVFDAPTEGTALWTEEHSLGLTDGYYAVTLGETRPLGPSVFAGPDRYLEISVHGDALQPRQRIGAAPFALACASARSAQGLLRGLWLFDEASGLGAADASGNGNAGALTAGTFTWQPSAGHNGGALSFSGTGEMTVASPNGLDLTDEITLEAWVYLAPGSTGNMAVVGREDAYQMAIFSVGSGGGTLSCAFRPAARPSPSTSAVGAVPLAAWTHLACSYDGNSIRNYLNGTLVSTTSSSFGPLSVSAAPLRIGGGGSSANQYFNGRIDEVRISALAKSFGGGDASPVGTVIASMLTEAQMQTAYSTAWVLADGRNVAGSRYALITGSSTVPDLRGLFLRGKNNGRSDGRQNPDGESGLAQYQADTVANHGHAVSDPGHTHNIPTQNGLAGSSEVGYNVGQGYDYIPLIPVTTSTTGVAVANTSAQGANIAMESRARNATVNYFIRIN